MIENNSEQAPVEEEIQIEITDEAPAEEKELEDYSKRVSKRVNKLNAKAREAEQRAAQYQQLAAQKDQELQHYRSIAAQSQDQTLAAEEEKIKAQEQQISEIYRQAVQSGDADLQEKATTLKNEIAIKKEKLAVAKAQRDQWAASNQQGASQAVPPEQQPGRAPDHLRNYEQNPEELQPFTADIEPTSEALSWHQKNPWYGDGDSQEHLAATQYAYFTHYNLVNEGVEPDSEEYYEMLDSRVKTAYPNLPTGGEPASDAAQEEQRPAVQRVASASPGSRPQTRGSKDGVKFSNSELDRVRGLKPHNMDDEQWLKAVAKEKQKIQQRGLR